MMGTLIKCLPLAHGRLFLNVEGKENLTRSNESTSKREAWKARTSRPLFLYFIGAAVFLPLSLSCGIHWNHSPGSIETQATSGQLLGVWEPCVDG